VLCYKAELPADMGWINWQRTHLCALFNGISRTTEIFLSADDEARVRLLPSLDYFVSAGWPGAWRLAYEVAEILRWIDL